MRGKRGISLATTLVALCSLCDISLALDPSGVMVLYNSSSADSKAIADYYLQVHPGAREVGITGISTSEDITADAYLSVVRPQVQSALANSMFSTNAIVTTKGMPLRIKVTEAAPTAPFPQLPTYTDPNNVTHTILNWNSYSSLESELADINAVSTWQMMGDQSYQIDGQFTNNPYFSSTAAFSHNTTGTYLTSRLDGFTVGDIQASINRAQNVFVGPQGDTNGPMHFIVDADPSKPYATSMTLLANNVLAGRPLTYDNTSAFVNSTTGPLLGYVSHGTNQTSTPANYIAGLNVTLANGAVFSTWESYNAYSFNPGGPHSNQGSIAQWLQKGGTAGVGNVEEPGGSTATMINEDIMFQALLSGKTFAEAAWSGAKQLSWVNTVVGDPLMTWKTLTYGDVNMDGVVDAQDLAIMNANWGKTMASGGYGWSLGDLNSDGVVNASDLTLLAANWQSISSWAMPPGGSPMAAQEVSVNYIPEPSSFVLSALAAVLASFGLWRRRRRDNAAR